MYKPADRCRRRTGCQGGEWQDSGRNGQRIESRRAMEIGFAGRRIDGNRSEEHSIIIQGLFLDVVSQYTQPSLYTQGVRSCRRAKPYWSGHCRLSSLVSPFLLLHLCPSTAVSHSLWECYSCNITYVDRGFWLHSRILTLLEHLGHNQVSTRDKRIRRRCDEITILCGYHCQ